MKVAKGDLSPSLVSFGLLPHRSQPSDEPFSFACKEVSPMDDVFKVNLIISNHFLCIWHLFHISVIWNISIISLNSLSPCLLHSLDGAVDAQTRRNCTGVRPCTPEQQGREVKHSRWGFCRHTPSTDGALFSGCHQEGRVALFRRSRTVTRLHPGQCFLPDSATWSMTILKESCIL